MSKPVTSLKELLSQMNIAAQMDDDTLVDASAADLIGSYRTIGEDILSRYDKEELIGFVDLLMGAGIQEAQQKGNLTEAFLVQSLASSKDLTLFYYTMSILKFTLGIAINEEIR